MCSKNYDRASILRWFCDDVFDHFCFKKLLMYIHTWYQPKSYLVNLATSNLFISNFVIVHYVDHKIHTWIIRLKTNQKLDVYEYITKYEYQRVSHINIFSWVCHNFLFKKSLFTCHNAELTMHSWRPRHLERREFAESFLISYHCGFLTFS